MAINRLSLWAHGASVHADHPLKCVRYVPGLGVDAEGETERELRDASGVEFRIKPEGERDIDNWFRVPIPTASVCDGRRLVLTRVQILFSTQNARITDVRLDDAGSSPPIYQAGGNLDLSGDHIVSPYIIDLSELSNVWLIKRGILASVNVRGPTAQEQHDVIAGLVKFVAVGAEFSDARYVTHVLEQRPM